MAQGALLGQSLLELLLSRYLRRYLSRYLSRYRPYRSSWDHLPPFDPLIPPVLSGWKVFRPTGPRFGHPPLRAVAMLLLRAVAAAPSVR